MNANTPSFSNTSSTFLTLRFTNLSILARQFCSKSSSDGQEMAANPWRTINGSRACKSPKHRSAVVPGGPRASSNHSLTHLQVRRGVGTFELGQPRS